MTTETGVNKEEDDEEDDTMQNTVVLFSNTDKFVLLQVQLLFEFFHSTCNENGSCLLNVMQIDSSFSSHILSSVSGYVCCVWQFWKGCGRAVASLCSVCPVLSSLLCEQ